MNESDYDPMIAVAANKTVVSLADGRRGRLVYWARRGEQATVVIEGRHVRVHKTEVATVAS